MNIPESYIYKSKLVKNEGGLCIYTYTWYSNVEDWQKEYLSQNSVNYQKCIDPDSKDDLCNPFYEALTVFLNVQEDNMKSQLKGQYIYSFNEINPYGIEVREVLKQRDGVSLITGPIFYLKSDQFGFSAPGASTDANHPYDTYIEQAKEKDKAMKDVAKWLYKTRRLGGSFLWPMEPDGKGGWIENVQYNKERGGSQNSAGNNRFYIEDRVDLTLLEVKQVLDSTSMSELNGNILWRNCINETKMKKWLNHFGTFETYVKFFCFDDNFVGRKGEEFVPIDITTKNKKLINLDDENCRTRKIYVKEKDKNNSETVDLQDMFNFVAEQIGNRTKKMIAKINDEEKK